jgi:hypothetical protein
MVDPHIAKLIMENCLHENAYKTAEEFAADKALKKFPCRICGKSFNAKLGNHLVSAHGITAVQYKMIMNIAKTEGLNTFENGEEQSEAMLAHWENNDHPMKGQTYDSGTRKAKETIVGLRLDRDGSPSAKYTLTTRIPSSKKTSVPEGTLSIRIVKGEVIAYNEDDYSCVVQEALNTGKSAQEICKDPLYPVFEDVYHYFKNNEKFAFEFDRARTIAKIRKAIKENGDFPNESKYLNELLWFRNVHGLSVERAEEIFDKIYSACVLQRIRENQAGIKKETLDPVKEEKSDDGFEPSVYDGIRRLILKDRNSFKIAARTLQEIAAGVHLAPIKNGGLCTDEIDPTIVFKAVIRDISTHGIYAHIGGDEIGFVAWRDINTAWPFPGKAAYQEKDVIYVTIGEYTTRKITCSLALNAGRLPETPKDDEFLPEEVSEPNLTPFRKWPVNPSDVPFVFTMRDERPNSEGIVAVLPTNLQGKYMMKHGQFPNNILDELPIGKGFKFLATVVEKRAGRTFLRWHSQFVHEERKIPNHSIPMPSGDTRPTGDIIADLMAGRAPVVAAPPKESTVVVPATMESTVVLTPTPAALEDDKSPITNGEKVKAISKRQQKKLAQQAAIKQPVIKPVEVKPVEEVPQHVSVNIQAPAPATESSGSLVSFDNIVKGENEMKIPTDEKAAKKEAAFLKIAFTMVNAGMPIEEIAEQLNRSVEEINHCITIGKIYFDLLKS